MTSVWLFEPRSHGRKRKRPRAQRGPVAGAATQFSRAPSIGVFGFVPVWARSIFSSSCVVVRAWCLVPGVRRRCFRRRCYASARGACGVQGGVLARGAAPVAAAAAAAACALRLSRRRARVPWKVRARWLRGARAGCQGGVRLASCRSCGRGVASLLRRRACAPPVPVLEMSLTSPQVVVPWPRPSPPCAR